MSNAKNDISAMMSKYGFYAHKDLVDAIFEKYDVDPKSAIEPSELGRHIRRAMHAGSLTGSENRDATVGNALIGSLREIGIHFVKEQDNE